MTEKNLVEEAPRLNALAYEHLISAVDLNYLEENAPHVQIDALLSIAHSLASIAINLNAVTRQEAPDEGMSLQIAGWVGDPFKI